MADSKTKRLMSGGVTLAYYVGDNSDDAPTVAMKSWNTVAEIKSTPSFNDDPSMIDVTDLSVEAGGYKEYVMGLRDNSSVKEFTVNLTDYAETTWETCVKAYEDLSGTTKVMWFCIYHPELANATYFQGIPCPMNINETSVDAALEASIKIVPTKVLAKRSAKPASSTTTTSGTT